MCHLKWTCLTDKIEYQVWNKFCNPPPSALLCWLVNPWNRRPPLPYWYFQTRSGALAALGRFIGGLLPETVHGEAAGRFNTDFFPALLVFSSSLSVGSTFLSGVSFSSVSSSSVFFFLATVFVFSLFFGLPALPLAFAFAFGFPLAFVAGFFTMGLLFSPAVSFFSVGCAGFRPGFFLSVPAFGAGSSHCSSESELTSKKFWTKTLAKHPKPGYLQPNCYELSTSQETFGVTCHQT